MEQNIQEEVFFSLDALEKMNGVLNCVSITRKDDVSPCIAESKTGNEPGIVVFTMAYDGDDKPRITAIYMPATTKEQFEFDDLAGIQHETGTNYEFDSKAEVVIFLRRVF